SSSSGMARFVLVLASMAAVASAQCALADHPNCANWARAGFCQNTAYTKTTLQQYCPKTCGKESGCVPDTTAPGTGTNTTTPVVEENKNCATWAADATKMFCASTTITEAQKKSFCKTTCAAEIAKTDDCAVYTKAADGKIKKEAAVKTGAAAVATNAINPITIAAIYAREKCTVDLFEKDTATVTIATDPKLQTFAGSATAVTAVALDAAKASLSMLCTCT
ncbi:hypothetical protein PMAYCL1PPCAC_30590, partial [Pristionchus mayeri]